MAPFLEGRAQRKCSGALGTARVEQFSRLAPCHSSEAPWGSWYVGSVYFSLAATSIWENFHKNQEGSGKGQQESPLSLGLRGTGEAQDMRPAQVKLAKAVSLTLFPKPGCPAAPGEVAKQVPGERHLAKRQLVIQSKAVFAHF